MRIPGLLLIAGLVVIAVPVRADQDGPACVESGDTLWVNGKRWKGHCEGGTRVALHGIAAPGPEEICRHESGRDFYCGRASAAFLLEQVKGRSVICRGDSFGADRRLLATCFVGGKELNALMVREGWAVADQRYSAKYLPDEEIARKARKNLWTMEWHPPWQPR
ncbi:MAG: thermonuclease family protein [Magnetospirillum sp. WYHS-4]